MKTLLDKSADSRHANCPETKLRPVAYTTWLAFLLISLAGLPQAIAQTRITTQPKSLAVLMSSNATFRVTATSTEPLVYQWQLDGRELADATNASLVVSHVTLADLGSYTVVVRGANGQAVSQPAWLKLARWTELVVFDASISFSQTSNGKSWVEWFAERACLSASGQVKNYATGGASCADVRSQIATYLRSYTPGANTLLAPWWAGMTTDLVWNYRPVEQVVSNYAANITQLAKGGGKIFILPTLVPLYLNPGFDSPYARSLDYQDINARMDREIQKLQADYGLTVFRFDYYGLGTNITANPTAYGFNNVTSAARDYCPPGDPNKFLWWDGIHPTTAFHHVMSEETYRCLTPPLIIAQPTGDASGVLDLQWQGGSPPFRLQRCVDLATGSWQSDELNFATNATTVSSAPQQYFRILQLGQ
jgi:hypothetical protein